MSSILSLAFRARFQIAAARPADLPRIRSFLDAANLPSSDLTDACMPHFRVARARQADVDGGNVRMLAAGHPLAAAAEVESHSQSKSASAFVTGEIPATAEDSSHGILGIGGLEIHGSAALLRSLAVVPAARGNRIAQALVAAIEAHARECRVAELALLTTTAAPYFASLGYAVIEREAFPAALRTTREFSSLCPASATCMSKLL